MKWKIGDRVIATNDCGSYSHESGTVSGFSTNTLGQALVLVKLDCNPKRSKSSCFYSHELKEE